MGFGQAGQAEEQNALPVNTGGEITFAPIVWPTYAGALMTNGEEPMSNAKYERGQLFWEVGADDVIRGHCRILVPQGEWEYIIYCHHPTQPKFVASQKLAHPLRIEDHDGGWIDLDNITEQDVIPPEFRQQK